MRKSTMNVSLGVLISALLGMAPAISADEVKKDTTGSASADRAADNTGVNKRDRQSSEPTAEQQKNNRSDLETTRLIRRAVVTDKSLSVYAHNIKIIAQDGVVTLKGPVRSEEEKLAVEKKAAEIAGAAQVRSEIEVAPKK
jgi:hyperosmotically inducible protein